MKVYPIILYTIILTAILGSCSTSSQIKRKWTTTYYGFLPCADCPGISYTLNLEKNRKYKLTRVYVNRINTISSEGKYTLNEGRLKLYQKDKIMEQYDQENDKLFFLDKGGNRITSLLAPHYTLYKGDASKAKTPKNFDR